MNIKRAAVFLLLFQAVSLFAQELAARYNFQDFTQTPQKIKTLTIEPLFSFGVNGTNIVTGDRRTFVTDTSGSKIVSNILAGYSYRVTLAGSYSTTVITNYFGTNVTGLVSASDPEYLTVSTNLNDSLTAYSKAQADARFALIGSGGGSNSTAVAAGTLTTASTNAGVVTISAVAQTNANLSAWSQIDTSSVIMSDSGYATNITLYGGIFADPNSFDAMYVSSRLLLDGASLPSVNWGSREFYSSASDEIPTIDWENKTFPSGWNIDGTNITDATINSNKLDAATLALLGGGAGDVTAAGNNTFTGDNTHSGTETFSGTVVLPASTVGTNDAVLSEWGDFVDARTIEVASFAEAGKTNLIGIDENTNAIPIDLATLPSGGGGGGSGTSYYSVYAGSATNLVLNGGGGVTNYFVISPTNTTWLAVTNMGDLQRFTFEFRSGTNTPTINFSTNFLFGSDITGWVLTSNTCFGAGISKSNSFVRAVGFIRGGTSGY